MTTDELRAIEAAATPGPYWLAWPEKQGGAFLVMGTSWAIPVLASGVQTNMVAVRDVFNALPALLAIAEAARLRRNVLFGHRDETVTADDGESFSGEWVAIPREDFDALRTALAALEAPDAH